MSAEEYIQELLEERSTLDPQRYGHALRLINDEMIRVGVPPLQKGPTPLVREYPPQPLVREYHAEPLVREYPPEPLREYAPEQVIPPPYKEEIVKLSEKVMLPITEFPKFNFIGRLLGPGGSIMKGIADQSRTKVSILGKGSSKNKAKEEELSKSDEAKYAHYKEPLHVFIQVEAPKSEGHARIADALDIIKECLTPRVEEQFGQMGGGDMMGDRFAQPSNSYRNDEPPAGRGRGSRGRGGRGGGRPEGGSAPRPLVAPMKDEYGYLPPSRFDDSGPSHYESPGRGGFRVEKRPAPANGFPSKKFREEPYFAPREEESYHFNAARY